MFGQCEAVYNWLKVDDHPTLVVGDATTEGVLASSVVEVLEMVFIHLSSRIIFSSDLSKNFSPQLVFVDPLRIDPKSIGPNVKRRLWSDLPPAFW